MTAVELTVVTKEPFPAPAKRSLYDGTDIPDSEIPEPWRQYGDKIRAVRCKPTLDLVMYTIAFGTGFFTTTMMSPTLGFIGKKVDPWYKYLIASSPIISGSIMRFFSGKATDRTGGRTPILILLVIGFIGSACMSAVCAKTDSKEWGNMEMNNGKLVAIFFIGWAAGAGVASFPCSMAMASYSGPKAATAFRQGVVGGAGNLTPAIPIIIYGLIQANVYLDVNYYIWTGVAVFGTLITFLFLKDPAFHQLLAMGVDNKTARDIAKWLGQEQFPPVEDSSLASDMVLGSFKPMQRRTVVIIILTYAVSFGGMLCISATLSTFIKARTAWANKSPGLFVAGVFVVICAGVRTLIGLVPALENAGDFNTRLGLILMFLGGWGVTLSSIHLEGIIVLGIVFCIGTGFVNYGCFAILKEKVAFTGKMGIIAGMVGGWGACGGPIFVWSMGFLSQVNPTNPPIPKPPVTDYELNYNYILIPTFALICLFLNYFWLPATSEIEDRPK